MPSHRIAVIGAGPAGLAAAERLSQAGCSVDLYDSMPSAGRKFLLAGKSGLNLTHSEDFSLFLKRFGPAAERLRPALEAFGPDHIRDWAEGLGAELFVGSSGRVFPKAMKASPLLRAWLRRLSDQGVSIHLRHRWAGFAENRTLLFETPAGLLATQPDAAILALGGASWPRLGSDAAWVPVLEAAGVPVSPLKPANCGFDVEWTELFRSRFAGSAVKSVIASFDDRVVPGEFVVTEAGIEGSLVYAHSAALRDALLSGRDAVLSLDLLPNRTAERIAADLAKQNPKQSFSNRLRKATGLTGAKAALFRECHPEAVRRDPITIASALKALPLRVVRTRPIQEAISTAGGISLNAIGDDYMIRSLPGVFAAGEMLDWEAPTGGYLLTACLATGRAAAEGALRYLEGKEADAERATSSGDNS